MSEDGKERTNLEPFDGQAWTTRGRYCAICGMQGGTSMTLFLRDLRAAGVPLKNNGNYAHTPCARELERQRGL